MIPGGENHAKGLAPGSRRWEASAHLGVRGFRDVQGLRQVQQALGIRVSQAALFLLSFPYHLAILVLP